jgi:hypothetical protein
MTYGIGYDLEQAAQEDLNQDLAILIEKLPHGSGIDCDWTLHAIDDHGIMVSNSYHNMNDRGMYDGWSDFVAVFSRWPMKLADVIIEWSENDEDDASNLADYLFETIDCAMSR